MEIFLIYKKYKFLNIYISEVPNLWIATQQWVASSFLMGREDISYIDNFYSNILNLYYENKIKILMYKY